MGRDPIDYCMQAQRRFGDVVRLPVGPGSVYLIVHPDDVEQVLVHQNRNHHKGRLFKRTDVLFGNGLVLNDGDDWHGQRRLMRPVFAPGRLQDLVPLMASAVDDKLATWAARPDPSEPLEMGREMMSLTLTVVARTMLSTDLSAADMVALAGDFNTVLRHLTVRLITFAFPEWTPLPGQRGCRAALRRIDELVYRMIDQRSAATQRPVDLLTLLVEARGEDGQPLPRSQIRDEVVTTLFGGYEATAHALAWTWYLLDRHPDVDARFRSEVAEVVQGDEVTAEQLQRLAFTSQIVTEALRLYPPFWQVFRTSYEASQVGGYALPPNAPIMLSPYVTHRHPAFWDDPEVFNPDRFGNGRAQPHPPVYFPFGAGQRICVGRHLALLEMQLILALVARRHRLSLRSGHQVELQAHSTVRAKGGMPMVLTDA